MVAGAVKCKVSGRRLQSYTQQPLTYSSHASLFSRPTQPQISASWHLSVISYHFYPGI